LVYPQLDALIHTVESNEDLVQAELLEAARDPERLTFATWNNEGVDRISRVKAAFLAFLCGAVQRTSGKDLGGLKKWIEVMVRGPERRERLGESMNIDG
jgi:hypothetical protein